ncbi:MAG: AbrB/MazE/SpoVT family DNA-binding domain-containing protein [Xanthobacteraceae bacterium]
MCFMALLQAAMPATVTSKARVTIPKQMRELLGIGPGALSTFSAARTAVASC